MVSICPRCRQPYSVALHSGDFNHTCNSGQTILDQEDVVVKGTYEDYTGSGGVPNIASLNMADELQATEAGNLGAKFRGVTERGNPAQINRQRQHIENIENPGAGNQ